MKDSDMLLLAGGGLLLLFLLSRNSANTVTTVLPGQTGLTPAQIAAQSAANNSAALIGAGTTALQSVLSTPNSGSSSQQNTSYSNYVSYS